MSPQVPSACAHSRRPEPVLVHDTPGGSPEVVGWLCPDCTLPTERPAPPTPTFRATTDHDEAQTMLTECHTYLRGLIDSWDADGRGNVMLSQRQHDAYQATLAVAHRLKSQVDMLDRREALR